MLVALALRDVAGLDLAHVPWGEGLPAPHPAAPHCAVLRLHKVLEGSVVPLHAAPLSGGGGGGGLAHALARCGGEEALLAAAGGGGGSDDPPIAHLVFAHLVEGVPAA